MWIQIPTETTPAYFIKSMHEHEMYKFYLTDFIRIWETSFNETDLEKLLLDNNPLLDAETSSLVKDSIELIFNELSKKNVQSTILLNNNNYGSINLSLVVSNKNFIIKLPLTFNTSNPETFSKEIIVPIIARLKNLQECENSLIVLLNKKDVEISEYKAEGAQLSLKHLETGKFNVESHNLKHNLQENLLNSDNISSVLTSLCTNLGLPSDLYSPNNGTEQNIKKKLRTTNSPKVKPKVETKIKMEIKPEPDDSLETTESKPCVAQIKMETNTRKKKLPNKRKLNFY